MEKDTQRKVKAKHREKEVVRNKPTHPLRPLERQKGWEATDTLKSGALPWSGGSICWSVIQYTKKLWVQSPGGAHVGGSQSTFLS